MKHLMIVFSIFLLPLSGCNFIQQVKQLPIDKQVQLITSITRTTTYFALKESIQSATKRMEIAEKIVNVVTKIQSDPSVSLSNEAIVQILSRYFPVDYVILFQNALDVLSMYYDPKIDVEQMIGAENILRLNGFLEGVKQGALMVAITKS